mgnify:CR=1 FL=1
MGAVLLAVVAGGDAARCVAEKGPMDANSVTELSVEMGAVPLSVAAVVIAVASGEGEAALDATGVQTAVDSAWFVTVSADLVAEEEVASS